MKAIAVQPEPAAAAALAKVSFVDAYGIACLAPGLTARRAAEALFTQKSVWIDALMALRNFIMRWFGVKTDAASYAPGASRIGMFPVNDEQPQQLLLGFDDRHLDFCIAVTVPARQGDAATTVTVTTAVATHNWLGRNYLRLILPFHRLIVRHMLQSARFS